MDIPSEQYHAELRAQAIRERPFAIAIVEPRPLSRKGPEVYALLFKSANQALLFWVSRWLFWVALGTTCVLGALNVSTNPPVILTLAMPVSMAGILRFMAERVDAPAGSELPVGTRLEQALVICRFGPTPIHIVVALACSASLAGLARVFGLL